LVTHSGILLLNALDVFSERIVDSSVNSDLVKLHHLLLSLFFFIIDTPEWCDFALSYEIPLKSLIRLIYVAGVIVGKGE
jgi:hypothetical protein